EQGDVWLMVESINKTVESPTDERDLRDLFEKLCWPELHAEVDRIRTLPAADGAPTRRPTEDILAELLDIARETGSSMTWRTEKPLGMLDRIYEAIINEEPPSLAALKKLKFSREGGALPTMTPANFERLAADPQLSFIADTPLPLKADDPKN